jgi:hypothetical protein
MILSSPSAWRVHTGEGEPLSPSFVDTRSISSRMSVRAFGVLTTLKSDYSAMNEVPCMDANMTIKMFCTVSYGVTVFPFAR